MARRFAVILIAGTATALLATPASAQSVATTFPELAATLPTGKEVIVTTTDGRRTRGDLLEITGTTLTLRVRDRWGSEERRQFAQAAVTRIRRGDPVWNGLLIGFGAGVAAAEIWRYSACGPRHHDEECSVIVFGVGMFTMVPGGAAVGALIDKFTNKLVFQSSAATALQVSPVLGRQQAGVAVSLRF